jgi:hypothetical protein
LLYVTSCSDLNGKVQGLAKGVGEFAELSFEDRAERINHLFMDKIVPFYRELIAATL